MGPHLGIRWELSMVTRMESHLVIRWGSETVVPKGPHLVIRWGSEMVVPKGTMTRMGREIHWERPKETWKLLAVAFALLRPFLFCLSYSSSPSFLS
jgi:hypothetical protein